jgi:hypothetical protein
MSPHLNHAGVPPSGGAGRYGLDHGREGFLGEPVVGRNPPPAASTRATPIGYDGAT